MVQIVRMCTREAEPWSIGVGSCQAGDMYDGATMPWPVFAIAVVVVIVIGVVSVIRRGRNK